MKNYAKIINGVVVEVISTDKEIDKLFHFATAKLFKEVSESVEVGWIEDDGEIKPPNQPSKDEIRLSKKMIVKNSMQRHINKYFTQMELIHLTALLSSGNTYAAEVYSWMQAGILYSLERYVDIDNDNDFTLDFSFMGDPPHKYEEVVESASN